MWADMNLLNELNNGRMWQGFQKPRLRKQIHKKQKIFSTRKKYFLSSSSSIFGAKKIWLDPALDFFLRFLKVKEKENRGRPAPFPGIVAVDPPPPPTTLPPAPVSVEKPLNVSILEISQHT